MQCAAVHATSQHILTHPEEIAFCPLLHTLPFYSTFNYSFKFRLSIFLLCKCQYSSNGSTPECMYISLDHFLTLIGLPSFELWCCVQVVNVSLKRLSLNVFQLQYHAGLASSLLNQQSLKRSANQIGASAKRRPKVQPSTLVLPIQWVPTTHTFNA